MERLDRNGIPILGEGYVSEMTKGCNSANCPPLKKSTSSPSQERTGATLGKYREIWPPVKWDSTLG